VQVCTGERAYGSGAIVTVAAIMPFGAMHK